MGLLLDNRRRRVRVAGVFYLQQGPPLPKSRVPPHGQGSIGGDD